MYLDNAATSFPKPPSVHQAMLHAILNVGASPGRGGHRLSLEANRLVFQTREAIANFFFIQDSSRIVFTANATAALNLALHGTLSAGDHVVTTSMEHNSLLRPLYYLRNRGIDLTTVQADSSGAVSVETIRSALKDNTKIVAIGHVSNVCGTIQPIAELGALCREKGILFLLDAAQSAGCLTVDVAKMNIDLLAVPGHKGLMGPAGTGFLYAAPGVDIRPVWQGGTGTNATMEEQPLIMPEGFEPGTLNLSGIAGLKAGIDFVSQIGADVIGNHARLLLKQVEESLIRLPGLEICGSPESGRRCSVLSFRLDSIDATDLAAMLDQEFDIAVRAGLHCAPMAHKTIGTYPEGTVRLSPGWFNTSEEIALFADAVVQCAANFGKLNMKGVHEKLHS